MNLYVSSGMKNKRTFITIFPVLLSNRSDLWSGLGTCERVLASLVGNVLSVRADVAFTRR